MILYKTTTTFERCSILQYLGDRDRTHETGTTVVVLRAHRLTKLQKQNMAVTFCGVHPYFGGVKGYPGLESRTPLCTADRGEQISLLSVVYDGPS